MTKDKKWLVVCLALVAALYLGWVFPWIWAAVLLLIIATLMAPTKAAPRVEAPLIAPLPHNETHETGKLMALERSLTGALAAEQNADVRKGLQRALHMVVEQRGAVISRPEYAAPQVPVQQRTAEEVAADKEAQELRNINTILYVASFLLVGAAALFIGFTSEIDQVGKFFALLFVTVAFYAVGMILYRMMPKIRPAAIAFVGTGLALIPFAGLGLYNYVLPDASLSWWLTSLVGLLAFWLALLVIRTQLMSYLTLAFVFSLTTSSVSVLDAAFVWYFVIVIATSSIMQLVSYRRGAALPENLRQPLEHNAQLAAPLALIGSLLSPGSLELGDYVLISAVGALHYGVSALGHPAGNARFAYWSAARMLAIVSAALLTQHLTDTVAWTAVTILAAGAVSHVGALMRLAREPRESFWLWVSQALVGLAVALSYEDMWNISAGLVILAVISTQQLRRLKRSDAAVGLLAALALLPLTVGRGALEPALDYKVLAVWALGVATIFFAIRLSRYASVPGYLEVTRAGYGLLALEALLLACIQADAAWTASVFIAAALLAYYSAFIERLPALHVISNLLAVVGTYLLLKEAGITPEWLPLATAWLLGLLWYVLRWYHELYSDEEPDRSRLDIMFISSAGILSIAAFYSAIANDVTAVAGALTGLSVAALVAGEGRHRQQVSLYEVAVSIATLSLQWLVHRAYPDAGLLFYTHWWALSLALIALLRLQRLDREGAKLRGIIALGLVTVPTGLYALSDPFTYQYLFLLEHVALLIGGFLLQRKFVIRWASVAIGLALLWLLSSFTYLLLVVIAMGLIALAIRRLTKQ